MKTVLYNAHVALGAKMVDFAGWEMPVLYKGVVPEHLSVRNKAGIFDVSHMGRVLVEGKDAEKFLDYLSTNKIRGKPDLSATYTVWPNASGGCVDDVIVYKQDPARFFIIVNARNRQKDLEHLKQNASPFEVSIRDLYQEEGILAVQGPQALQIGAKLLPDVRKITPMHFLPSTYQGRPLILSGTGYTGAGGFEIYAPLDLIPPLWKAFLTEGVEPIGLGARDTLRLEMGYALYGHEINDAIAPNESVSAWTVKWDKRDFFGKSLMEQLQSKPGKRSEHGVVLLEKGIPREGYEVYKSGMLIGKVTSGTYSPTLNKGIAIILVNPPLKKGDHVEIKIRDNRIPAQVTPLPFIEI